MKVREGELERSRHCHSTTYRQFGLTILSLLQHAGFLWVLGIRENAWIVMWCFHSLKTTSIFNKLLKSLLLKVHYATFFTGLHTNKETELLMQEIVVCFDF